jgi:hypothetical protein
MISTRHTKRRLFEVMSRVAKTPLNEDAFDAEDQELQLQDNIEADLIHNDFNGKKFEYEIPVKFSGNIIDENVEYAMVEGSAHFEEPTKFAVTYLTNAKGFNITIALVFDVIIRDKFDGVKFVFYTINHLDSHNLNVSFNK